MNTKGKSEIPQTHPPRAVRGTEGKQRLTSS